MATLLDTDHTLVQVCIVTDDPVSRAGVAAQLRGERRLRTVDQPSLGPAVVALVVVDEIDDATVQGIRELRGRGVEWVAILTTRLDDAGLMRAVEAGARSVLRRSQATTQNLSAAIVAVASGDGLLPPDMLGRLLQQVGQLQRHVLAPRGLTFRGLSEREANVLRLLAEGFDTAEVGRRLYYSERTVKNIVHDITSRLELRNRTHAVAHAIRNGLI